MLGPPEREGDLGTLGPYRIEAELGRGGMGIVYRGFDETLRRTVAVKVPTPERLAGDRGRRLVREARIAARFRHANAVSIHAVAETAAGNPYIVMEYVAGPSLADVIRARSRLAPAEAAEIAAEIAMALAAAHEAGLIHRDVKPANILIDPEMNRARIVDFGMARSVDSPAELTREGAIFGTPAYMSPEQVVGDPEIDGRADVYGLGASLYEALAGEPPFLGTPLMVVHQILNEEPRPPRRLNESIPRDLDTICLKAIAKDPRQRYADARAMAVDLKRWLGGEPIAARPPGPIERIWRWAKRERRIAVLLAAVIALLTSLAAGATVAALMINSALLTAVTEKARADQEARAAETAQALAAQRARVATEQRALAFDTVASLAKEIQEELARSPNTLELRGRLADVAIKRLERVAQISGDDEDVALARVVARDRIGDLDFSVGRTADARRIHELAREEARALASRSDASAATVTEAKRSLARAVDKLGDLDILAGDIKAAKAGYMEARAIREAMPDSYRQSLVGLREQAVSAQKIGDLDRAQGRPQAARDEYARGLALIEATSGIEESQHLADLRFSHSRLGEAQLALFEFDLAVASFQKALGYAEAMVNRNPSDPKARRAVDAATNLLGDAAIAMGDSAGALALYRKYLAGRQAQSAAEPGNAETRRDVSLAHGLIAKALLGSGDSGGSIASLKTSLEIALSLERDDPSSVQKCGDVIECCKSLADVASRSGDFNEAASWIRRALLALEKGVARGLATPVQSAPITTAIETQLAVYQGASRALDDERFIDTQPPGVSKDLRLLRALTLASRGRCAEAASAAAGMLSAVPHDGETLVGVARIYASCARALERQVAAETAGPAASVREYQDKAVEALREAARVAPAKLHAIFAPDLDPIRRHPLFKDVFKPLGD